MNDIVCPQCKKVFKVDEAGFADILKQVRDHVSDKELHERLELAEKEWICRVTSGKKAETRSIRIKKAISKLKGGMRRPCCWVGCPHR